MDDRTWPDGIEFPPVDGGPGLEFTGFRKTEGSDYFLVELATDDDENRYMSRRVTSAQALELAMFLIRQLDPATIAVTIQR